MNSIVMTFYHNFGRTLILVLSPYLIRLISRDQLRMSRLSRPLLLLGTLQYIDDRKWFMIRCLTFWRRPRWFGTKDKGRLCFIWYVFLYDMLHHHDNSREWKRVNQYLTPFKRLEIAEIGGWGRGNKSWKMLLT